MGKQRFRVVRVEIIDVDHETPLSADDIQKFMANEAINNDGAIIEVINVSDNESVAFEYVGETKQIVVSELKN